MRVLPWCLPVFVFAGSIAFAQSPPIPEQQQKFLSIIYVFTAKRAKALCDLMQSPKVEHWVGTIYRIENKDNGKGAMHLWMSESAHDPYPTIRLGDEHIDPGTPVYEAVVQLREKQKVVFSGTFVRGDRDCFRTRGTCAAR